MLWLLCAAQVGRCTCLFIVVSRRRSTVVMSPPPPPVRSVFYSRVQRGQSLRGQPTHSVTHSALIDPPCPTQPARPHSSQQAAGGGGCVSLAITCPVCVLCNSVSRATLRLFSNDNLLAAMLPTDEVYSLHSGCTARFLSLCNAKEASRALYWYHTASASR